VKRLFAVPILLLLVLSVFVFPIGSDGSSVFYVSAAFFVLALAAASWEAGPARGLKYLGLVFEWKNAPLVALQALALFALCAAATASLSALLYFFGALDTQGVYEKVVALPIPALIAAFTLAPLGEEAFFRGFFFRKIGEMLGGRKMIAWAAAAFASSAIFAALHAPYGSVAEVAVAFFLGILLCAGTMKSGSLLPAVLAHAAFNFASIAMAVLL
jgi:membrane protease YdiL (CAAX protease family)